MFFKLLQSLHIRGFTVYWVFYSVLGCSFVHISVGSFWFFDALISMICKLSMSCMFWFRWFANSVLIKLYHLYTSSISRFEFWSISIAGSRRKRIWRCCVLWLWRWWRWHVCRRWWWSDRCFVCYPLLLPHPACALSLPAATELFFFQYEELTGRALTIGTRWPFVSAPAPVSSLYSSWVPTKTSCIRRSTAATIQNASLIFFDGWHGWFFIFCRASMLPPGNALSNK